MFRPEMLRPMGLPEDVQVIAWSLSVERWEQNTENPIIVDNSKLTNIVEGRCWIDVNMLFYLKTDQLW
jgi:hypothetical protein